MEDNMQEGIRVFISYAHEDQRLRKRLEAHLALLQQQGLITTWHDRKIIAGTEWASEIDAQLNTSQIILLLVSAAFLASKYCYGIEMAQALKRHEAGQARVIPVILRPVDWRIAPLSKLQALPTDAEPVTGRRWRNIDEACADVSRGIREVIQTLNGQLAEEDTVNPQDTDNSQNDRQKSAFDFNAFKMVGDVHFQYGQYEDALIAYNQALALEPGNFYLHHAVGNTLFRLSRYGEALAAYSQVLRLDPDNADVYREVCKALSEFVQRGYGKNFTYFRDYERRFSVLLAGPTGAGKSSLANALTGRSVAEEVASTYGTSWVQPYEIDIQGIRCLVIDTPGLLREDEIDSAHLAQMQLFMRQQGIDCMLYLAPSQRWGGEAECKCIAAITQALGRDIWTKSVVVLTFADNFRSSDEYLRWISKQTEQLLGFIATCAGNERQDSEQIVDGTPFVAVAGKLETTLDGQNWLGPLHLAILLTLYRHVKTNGTRDSQV